MKHVYPFESNLHDISDLKNSDIVIVMYREFGQTLADLLGRPVLQAPFGLSETEHFIENLGRLTNHQKEAAAFQTLEKKTILKPIWDLWRGPQSEWFPTIRFGVIADQTYTEGLKKFLSQEMGMQCLFNHNSQTTNNNDVREELAKQQPQFLFGRMADKIYLAELGAKTRFIPAGFPGPIVRRALGTPFMGHSGAVYLLQEIVNALYDTLFHFLPISMRSSEGAIETKKITWTTEANAILEEIVKKAPFISQISFGRDMKKKAEALATKQGKETVTPDILHMLK